MRGHVSAPRRLGVLPDAQIRRLCARCCWCYLRPDPLRVGSAWTYPMPGRGVGGSGSPRVTVRSCPVSPPRGPTSAYWPELGAMLPECSGGLVAMVRSRPATPAARRTPAGPSRSGLGSRSSLDKNSGPRVAGHPRGGYVPLGVFLCPIVVDPTHQKGRKMRFEARLHHMWVLLTRGQHSALRSRSEANQPPLSE
jgi:hypothetical protein